MANDAVRRTPQGYLAWLEEKIVALERRPPGSGGGLADSGWIPLELLSSFWTGGYVEYRTIGQFVTIRIRVEAASIPDGDAPVNTATSLLPAELRPPVGIAPTAITNIGARFYSGSNGRIVHVKDVAGGVISSGYLTYPAG